MKRVLVTGGAGFIGSYVTDRMINEDYEVTVLDNLSTGLRSNVSINAKFIKGDVRNPKDIEKCFKDKIDVICHIAGCASTIKSFDDPLKDLNTNTAGTVNMVMAAIKHKVSRFLYASSMTAYGVVNSIPTKEEYPCRPISYYGITKYAGERYVMATGLRKDLGFKFNPTAFRMFNVYGRRQSLTNPYQGVVSIFIGNVARGEPIKIFGDGKQSRDYIHAFDVADAWAFAINNEESFNEVLNLGSGTNVSINGLVNAILRCFGKDSHYDIRYLEERPGDQRHMQASIEKTKNILMGWQPEIEFSNGLQDVVRWSMEKKK